MVAFIVFENHRFSTVTGFSKTTDYINPRQHQLESDKHLLLFIFTKEQH